MKAKICILLLEIIAISVITSCNKEENDDDITIPIEDTSGTFTDNRDGKIYQWIKIGNQIWMAENLNYDTINESYVYNNISSNANIYGLLYDFETACLVCPDGWHLPSDSEWTQLTDYLGGEYLAGGKLKEDSTEHWEYPNIEATNSSGFTALPGGNHYKGSFCNLTSLAYFWTSSNNNIWGIFRSLYFDDHEVTNYLQDKEYCFSVRCVKD